jgi:hypothetical protein
MSTAQYKLLTIAQSSMSAYFGLASGTPVAVALVENAERAAVKSSRSLVVVASITDMDAKR